MKIFKTMMKNELKLSLRGMDMFIFAICMPVIVTVILGVIYGNKPAFDGAEYTFVERSFGAYLLVMVSMFSIGFMVGGIAKDTKAAGIIASILYFPMLIFSGSTLPYEVMPKSLQRIADIMPLTQGIKLLKSACLNLSFENAALPIVAMGVIAIACTGMSIKFFRWE